MFNKHKRYLGIEIDDNSIRILELSSLKGEEQISAQNEVLLGSGVVEDGQIKNEKILAKKLKEALSKAKPKLASSKIIHFALPEELIFSHIFQAELSPGKGIKQIVAKEYEQHIASSISDGEYAFKVVDKAIGAERKHVLNVVLAAAAKKSLLAWQNFFEQEKLTIDFFDLESLAVYRGIFTEPQTSNIGILNIKKNYSNFTIFTQNGLEYAFSTDIGLMQIDQDEQKQKGPSVDARSANAALQKLTAEIKDNLAEAAKLILGESATTLTLEKIVLMGAGAEIPNIIDLFSKQSLSISFELGGSKQFVDLDRRFLGVLGLALRSLDQKWEKNDLTLPCIGHAYQLEKQRSANRVEIISLWIFVKKFIIFPLSMIFLLFAVWFYMGTKSSNKQTESVVIPPSATAPEKKTKETEIKAEALKPEVKSTNTLSTTETKNNILIIYSDIPLNVRSGPGTSFDAISKIASGSEQVMLKEQDGWYKILWEGGVDAWIKAEYAQKK